MLGESHDVPTNTITSTPKGCNVKLSLTSWLAVYIQLECPLTSPKFPAIIQVSFLLKVARLDNKRSLVNPQATSDRGLTRAEGRTQNARWRSDSGVLQTFG